MQFMFSRSACLLFSQSSRKSKLVILQRFSLPPVDSWAERRGLALQDITSCVDDVLPGELAGGLSMCSDLTIQQSDDYLKV